MNTKPMASADATNTPAYTIPHQTLDRMPSAIDLSLMTVIEHVRPYARNMAPHMPPPITAPTDGGTAVVISTIWYSTPRAAIESPTTVPAANTVWIRGDARPALIPTAK